VTTEERSKAAGDSDHLAEPSRRFKNFLQVVQFSKPTSDPTTEPRTATIPLEQVERVILRVGLAAFGVFCWGAAARLWEQGDMVTQSLSVALSLVLYVVSFAMFVGAAYKRPSGKLTALMPVALVLVFASYWQVDRVSSARFGVASPTDVWLYTDYDARLVRLGENPYEHDLSPSYLINRATQHFGTPLLDGDFTSRAAYPALSFLIYVPFQALDIPTPLVYPLFTFLTMLAMFWAAPPILRPLVLLPVFADPRYILYGFGGVSDIVWAFMLVMTIATWDKRRQRAVWFGLACAFKQQPWFLAPFLLIRIWRDSRRQPTAARRRLLLEFCFVTGAVFLVFNAPYMLSNLPAWINGITEPLQAHMIILGQGISSLMMLGYVNIPKVFFSLFVFGTFAVAVALYWRHYEDWREVMWILPGIVFWLGHRSLSSYWYFFALPLVVSLLRNSWNAKPQLSPEVAFTPARNLRWSLALLAIPPVFVVGSLLWYGHRDATLTASLEGAVQVSGDRVVRMNVHVVNHQNTTITPRFSVQSWSDQPFFWRIEDGPEQLGPNQTGSYTLSSDGAGNGFSIYNGAQVIVSDAEEYNPRASFVIQSDLGYRYYDAIANGSFRFWDATRNVPAGWGLLGEPGTTVQYVDMQNNAAALHFRLPSPPSSAWTIAMLDTWIPFPTSPVQVWVNPPANANQPANFNLVYGFELFSTTNQNRVWVLFGDEARHGEIQPGLYYWMMPAPRETWSQQTFNARQVFDDLGLEVSPPQLVSRFGVNFPVSMMNFRLLLAARNQSAESVSADFGPVSTGLLPDPGVLMDESIEHPEWALMWRAQQNLLARNYEKAREDFTQAIIASPDLADAYMGLGRASGGLGNWEAAGNAFEVAILRGYIPIVEAQNALAEALDAQGRKDEAYQVWRQAETTIAAGSVSIANQITTYLGLGQSLMGQGQCEQAAYYFQRVLALDPDDGEAQTALAQCVPVTVG
jgi:hypothetical protein